MTAKEYLQSVKDADTQIKVMIDDLHMMRETMYSIQGVQISGDRVQTSPKSGAKFEGLLSNIDEKEQHISQKISELIDFKLKVSEQISELKVSAEQKKVLHMHYIRFKSMYDIGKELGYIVDDDLHKWVYGLELRKEALKAFEAKYHDMLQEMGDEQSV